MLKAPQFKRKPSDNVRIFLGPNEVAGYYKNLEEGFRRIGIQADHGSKVPHPFAYEEIAKRLPLSIRLWQFFGRLRSSTPRSRLFRKVVYVLCQEVISYFLIFILSFRYNVFIYTFATTITNTEWELKLHRFLGNKLIFMFHGSDSRPQFVNGAIFPVEEKIDWSIVNKATQAQKKRISSIEHYADYLVNYVPQSAFHERRIINSLMFGLPLDPDLSVSCWSSEEKERPIRILHAPSRLSAKGTAEILAAIDRLRSKGHRIDLIKIHGMPNAKVLEELSLCDFVVDQLYSDTPMATFATEAAHFGKPAVVGGYFADQIQNHYRREDIPPSLYVHPDKLESAIERLIVDGDYRLELGKRACEFVRTRWMPEHVAARYLRLIEEDIPPEWWFDPRDIRYLHGVGIPEWRAREMVRGLVERYGVKALQLSDKPELEQAFLDFAGLSSD